jgi:hypothetical protein
MEGRGLRRPQHGDDPARTDLLLFAKPDPLDLRFVNFSSDLKFNLLTDEWFLPLDIMVGRKFGLHWIASIEYPYGMLSDDDCCNQ